LAADSLSNNKPIHEHASEQTKHEVDQTGPYQVVTCSTHSASQQQPSNTEHQVADVVCKIDN
jgi:hypothetical protein